MMIPGQAILIPMFQFLKSIGLLNTLTGLSLSYLGGSVAFAIFLMRALLPEPAAGARRCRPDRWLHRVRRVPLRLSAARCRPGIATVVIIQSMGTWNEFMFSNTFISSPGSKTIQAALIPGGRPLFDRLHRAFLRADAGAGPIVTVYLILQKQFVAGTDGRRPQGMSPSPIHAKARTPTVDTASAGIDPSIRPVTIGRLPPQLPLRLRRLAGSSRIRRRARRTPN